MSNTTLDNEDSSSQLIRPQVYNALELMVVLFNFLIMFYTLVELHVIYKALGIGFIVPFVIGFSLCSAPIVAVKKWRWASLLYDRKKNTSLLFKIDTDSPNRHLTLLSGAIWLVVGVGILVGVLSGMLLVPMYNKLLFRCLLAIPFLLLGLGQIGYILSGNRILNQLKNELDTDKENS